MGDCMSRTTILHVDDDSNDVLLFQHACRKAGWAPDVQTVTDGDEAVAYLQGAEKFADREACRRPCKRIRIVNKARALKRIIACNYIHIRRRAAVGRRPRQTVC